MKLILAAVAVCLANAASAITTVTFDHVEVGYNPSTGAQIGTSNGFIYDFSWAYLQGNQLGLLNDSGITTSTIKAVTGLAFTPHSIKATGESWLNIAGPGPAPKPSLTFFGMRGGSTVASLFVPFSTSSVTFSSAFNAIDALIVQLNIPSAVIDPINPSPGAVWCVQFCAEYHLDNLVVTPNVATVPLPASGLLPIGAIAGLFGIRRRRITAY